MTGRNAAERWAVSALALPLLLALPACSSGEKPAAAKPEPIEISEADQRINADTDPLNGGDAPPANAASASAAPVEAEARAVDRVTLEGGLVIEDLREGQGPLLMSGEGLRVTVHYVGRLVGAEGEEGPVFDSTYTRGQPVTLELDRLIRGWRQGLPGMRIGGLRRLTIPPEMAYGDEGYLNVPGGATLVYEVLLLGFSQ